jgi:hypothetical protein
MADRTDIQLLTVSELVELARKHKITPKEHAAQVRSFTYGNLNLHDPSITREDVEAAVTALDEDLP